MTAKTPYSLFNSGDLSVAKNLQLVVLISGSGSNLQSIIDAIENGQINANIAAVISNVADVRGLQRANDHDIPAHTLPHGDFATRGDFDQALQKIVNNYEPDLVILAGFMRILGPDISRYFKGKMLNIHPSLLPKYPGLHTHQKVLDNHESHHGTTIHFVTEELDGGPIVYQRSFEIQPNDTPETLFRKVQALEHQMYPQVIQWIAEGRLKYQSGPMFDDTPLDGIGISQAMLERVPTV